MSAAIEPGRDVLKSSNVNSQSGKSSSIAGAASPSPIGWESAGARADNSGEHASVIHVGALRKSIDRFNAWLEKAGYESYDPYDIWGTSYGLFSRRVYYQKGWLGLPLIAPILLMDILCPGLRSVFVHKERFATADAQLILAFLNIHRCTKKTKFLERAIQLGDELLQYSIPGYRGKCWGYPFDWQNNRGLWRKDTPYITCTPYCFEAFLALYDATGNEHYRDIARSIAEFVCGDLKDTAAGNNAMAASYSPKDETKVINASAYRAWVLFEAGARFDLPGYKEKARRNLNFILQNQRPDGAWLYAIEAPGEEFIDHFHTCFVLKNLFKINRRLEDPALAASIRKGFDYYRRELFDTEGLPKGFAIQPRTQIVKLEMYNFAEAITLGVLLGHEIPEAFTLAQRLAARLCENYQLPKGYFVTRVYRGGFRHSFPFLRWPQAQLFYSLTNLLLAMQKGGQ